MEELKKYIKVKDYQEAFLKLSSSFDDIKEEFEIETFENPNENLFEFIIYAGNKANKSNLVYFCSMILATSLNYFNDAYKYSYALAWKLVKIEPLNIENWEWLLFFANVPDIEVSKKKLTNTIINTLKLDKNNTKALDLLNIRFTVEEKRNILDLVNTK